MKKIRIPFLTALFFGMTTVIAHAAEAGVKEKTMMDLFHEGGWVMYPITVCSVATIWLIIDCTIRTGGKKLYPANHVLQLRELFKQGDYVASFNFAKASPSPVCDIVKAGLGLAPDGKVMAEEAVISEISRVQADLMGRASYLSVIGVCTPMIGLTGTVTGMMKAFDKLGSSGVGDPSQLAAAIGEVLVATGAGLFIAIPAFMAYYLVRNRVTKGIHDLQEITNGLFRSFPYDEVAGQNIGDMEIYAAKPVWSAPAEGVTNQ